MLTCDLEVERKKDWEHRAYTTVDGRERKRRKREGIFNVDRVGEYVVSSIEENLRSGCFSSALMGFQTQAFLHSSRTGSPR